MAGERSPIPWRKFIFAILLCQVVPLALIVTRPTWDIPIFAELGYVEGPVSHCQYGHKGQNVLFRIEGNTTLFISPGNARGFYEICQRSKADRVQVAKVGYVPDSPFPPNFGPSDGQFASQKTHAWDVSINGEAIIRHADLTRRTWWWNLASVVGTVLWEAAVLSLFALLPIRAVRRGTWKGIAPGAPSTLVPPQ